MSSEDQFTSIQWDRDDGENTNNTPTDTTIKSKSSKSKKSKNHHLRKRMGIKYLLCQLLKLLMLMIQ